MVAHAENDAFAAAVAISVGKTERARNGPRAEDGFPGCDFHSDPEPHYLFDPMDMEDDLSGDPWSEEAKAQS